MPKKCKNMHKFINSLIILKTKILRSDLQLLYQHCNEWCQFDTWDEYGLRWRFSQSRQIFETGCQFPQTSTEVWLNARTLFVMRFISLLYICVLIISVTD
jgi:hypothetical protein